MSLSSLIVQREIASIREIEEALARQVLYGGDFVTNLFEVSRVDESALMPIVAESFGLRPAPSGELPIAPVTATRLVAADVVAERGFAPLSVGRSLVVAVAEPLSREAEQELAFTLALPIEQRIAPLFRIRQALARDYGVPLDKRTARLITKIVNNAPGVSSTTPPPMDAMPMFRTPPRPPSVAPPPKIPAELREPAAVAGSLVRKSDVPPPKPVRRHRGPLTSDVAKAELDAAVDRDVIFDLLFEFARQFFDYTAVFLVHGEAAEGRDSFGDGATRDKVARLRVPLDSPNMLSKANESKSFVRQRPSRQGIDQILMSDLGRDGTSECVVFPIIVRKRVVAMVFGDGGQSGVDLGGVGQVSELIGSAAGAFERVIMRRKLKGGFVANEGAPQHVRHASERQMPAARAEESLAETSERPTSEELAPPIRDLLADPAPPKRLATEEAAPGTRHDPLALAAQAIGGPEPKSARSELPPPPSLLAVRRPSGRPIPREEPAAQAAAPVVPVPAPTEKALVPERRTKSQSLKRAEAPTFEFGGTNSVPPVVTEEITATPRTRIEPGHKRTMLSGDQSLVAEAIRAVQAAEAAAARGTSTTDMSPQVMVTPEGGVFARPPEPRRQTLEEKVTIADTPVQARAKELTTTLISGSPLTAAAPKVDARRVTPLVVVTPDHDMKPVSLASLKREEPTPRSPEVSSEAPGSPDRGPEPVLALSTRKGGVPSAAPSEPRSMPISEQQVSVAAHKPPTSRTESTSGLPSVIVDVGPEYTSLVERALSGGGEEAEAELVRAGGYAMPALIARFPGPIAVEADRLETGALPHVAECGPVIRLVAIQRRAALPFVLTLVEGADEKARFWATYLLTELVYPEAIDAAIARALDDDARMRRVARASVRALAEAYPQLVVDRLGHIANEPSASRRLRAIEALAETREPAAVRALMPLLEEDVMDVVTAARNALVFITQQDFGRDTDKWLTWWEKHHNRHRLEWLIDSLMHDQRALRGGASEELRGITKEFFGYHDDLPKRERERAQARWREWWDSVGRVRFSRASNRGI
jgi:hypothetical protein